MTSQIGNIVHISTTKGDQAMKFVQLLEYNVRNIFLGKPYRKWDRDTSCRPLSIFKKTLYDVKASD